MTCASRTGRFAISTGAWRFDAIGQRGCRVHFKVEFEFKNRLSSAAFNAVFETLCSSIVDAFVVRAQKVYGLEVAS